MKTRKVSIAIFAALVGGLVFGLSHAEKGIPAGKGRAAKAARFTAAGVYSGPLSGSVLIGTETVEIGKGTRISQVGAGPLEVGAVVRSSGVYVSGVVRKGKMVARTVLVSEPESSQDFSETTLANAEGGPNRAQ